MVCGVVFWRSARPIEASTASTAVIDTLPLGALGVPTEMNDTSVWPIAASTSVVAVSLPSATPLATSSSISTSTMGDLPWLIRATLSAATSTATTVWPTETRHPLETTPT